MPKQNFVTSPSFLPAPRGQHDTFEFNGLVYTVGGYTDTASTAAQATNQIHRAHSMPDGTLSKWTLVGTFPKPRFGHSVTFTDRGFIYVIGGFDTAAAFTNTVYVATINPDGGISPWKTLAPFPILVAGHDVFAYGDSLIVVGGFNNGPSTSNVYRAQMFNDGTLGPWKAQSPLPVSLGYSGLTTISDGYVLVSGGYTFDGAVTYTLSNKVFRAKLNSDGTLGKWATSTVTLPVNLSRHAMIQFGDYVYVMGGSTDQTAANSVQTLYQARIQSNGDIGPFIKIGDHLPAHMRDVRVSILNNIAYVVGGFNQDTVANQAAVYTIRVHSDGTL